MELKGEGQIIPKPFLSVSPPDNEGIIENAAVHTDCSVDFRIYDGGSTNDHAVFGQISVLTACGDLRRMLQILLIELIQIGVTGQVAGADFAFFIFHDGIDRYGVIL